MIRELTVSEWKEEINRALEYRKLYGLESSWAEMEALFYNVHDSNAHAGPNIIYSTGDALMSTMSVPYPYITAKARRTEFLASSKLTEHVDNDLIETMDCPEEAEKVVLSAYLWGRGIAKIGYDSEFGWDPSMDLGLLQQTPLGLTLTQFDRNQKRIEFNAVKPGMPWVSRVLPHDFVVPWGVFGIKDAPWCAHRKVRHLEECRADPKYDTKGLRPVMSAKDFVESYKKVPAVYRTGEDITKGFGFSDTGETEYVELWEIHDRQTGKIYVIATGYDSFLRNEQDHLQIEGLPFVDLSLVPRARTFWTTSDAFYLRQCQHESADIALQAQKQRRARVLRMLYGEDAFSPDELDKLLSSDVGVAAKVSGGQNIQESVAFLQPPGDQMIGVDAEMNRRDAREVVGFSRNQMGEYESTGRRTASEANIVQQAASLRMDRRQAVLAKFYLDIFKKINPIIQKFWQVPKWAEVVGQDGAQRIIQYTGQELQGEFQYQLGFSLAPQETLQQRRQNALQMYAMLRQDPLMNPFGLARYLNMNFNEPEFASLFQPGVLDGKLEMLSAMQNQQAGGAGMGEGQPGSMGAGPQGQGSAGNGSSAKRPGSVQTAGAGTRS